VPKTIEIWSLFFKLRSIT